MLLIRSNLGHLHSMAPSNEHILLWGAQAASLQLPAVCRQHFRAANPEQRTSRQAAESSRLPSCAPRSHATAAITFNSIAIGVGSAVISIVVRVGFGLPSPAKCSA